MFSRLDRAMREGKDAKAEDKRVLMEIVPRIEYITRAAAAGFPPE